LHNDQLPFDLTIDAYHDNSVVVMADKSDDAAKTRVTNGSGVGAVIEPRARFTGAGGDAEKVDMASAYVTVRKAGQAVGTYLLSLHLPTPQRVEVDGKAYQLALRFKRYYKPYTVELLRFDHDKYLGTTSPKNFSSRVRLKDETTSTNREILIKMNSPLRYRGETFFQARFIGVTPEHPWETTILQIVDNPGWLLPYVACLIGAIGMGVHFTIALTTFLRKRLAPASQLPARGQRAPVKALPVPASGSGWAGWAAPVAIAGICFLYALSAGMNSDKPKEPFNLQAFAKIPVTYNGRVQPIDSLAINSLRIISGKAVLRDNGEKYPAIKWLADVFAGNDAAMGYKVFRIDHPDIKAALDLKQEDKYFSADEIMRLKGTEQERAERLAKIEEVATPAAKTAKKDRDLYQQKWAELAQHLNLFAQLRQWERLLIVPPAKSGGEWQSLITSVQQTQQGTTMPPAARSFVTALDAYDRNDSATFNREVGSYAQLVDPSLAQQTRKVGFEVFFNTFAPFYVCMVLYVIVFVLACVSWLGFTRPLWRSAMGVLLITLAVHSFGLIARMYISGRPPVTNLYSSAVFVAWGTVMLALALDSCSRTAWEW
jgi:hypothetical protein